MERVPVEAVCILPKTEPGHSPICLPCYDDAVQDIGTEARYFIAVEMDSGYWQLVGKEEAHKRLAFFSLDRNQWCKVMHTGDLNSYTTFVSMIMNLQMEQDTLEN